MDAKAHRVHPLDGVEMICLVRRDLRQKAAAASADQVADPDAAVRRNFRGLSLAPVRGYHPSASAGAQEAELDALQMHSEMLPLVADQSAGRVPGVQIVLTVKVVGHLDPHGTQMLRVVAHRKGARPAAARAHRVAAPAGAKARAQSCLKPPPELEPLAQLALPPEPEPEPQASPQQAQE